jgi:hypothetical protein
MSTQSVVRPVVSTTEAKPENKAVTFVNNIPDELLGLDEELNAGYTLQSEIPNESDFRVGYLVDAIVAANKARARANVAGYERAIDKMSGLTCYRKTHTRDQVETAFLQTRDGKILAEIKKCSAEYLETHK